MKAIWTNDVAEYHGAYVDFDPSGAGPKPVQKPHPPIIVGGAFPHGAAAPSIMATAGCPIGGRDLDALDDRPRFRQMVAEAGRDPDSMPMSMFGAPHDLDLLKRYRDARIDRTVLLLPTAASGPTLKTLDACARLMPGALTGLAETCLAETCLAETCLARTCLAKSCLAKGAEFTS